AGTTLAGTMLAGTMLAGTMLAGTTRRGSAPKTEFEQVVRGAEQLVRCPSRPPTAGQGLYLTRSPRGDLGVGFPAWQGAHVFV
ncbi:MAG: hypothetical protein M1435_00605, partial [Actinobacteria bacterium]|nr:hypothetical protein [Actinomycetota bacterium]